ncbi:putative oxidoreductase; putative molybdoenzyme [Beijerinckiaceae bacterium RH AL1]|nr:FdhF/YdeP family oxidoreductase [Beijerinckiaceae bacterium]VVB42977.1 putative oxidoreductase; putative molybdoenzyme [Beijerinckiaceae bacterium RH AL8]VVB42990.1 putative oxidoreductase; putative molybdoenzyme [Beijerinckiaceae bacterium RH CH11]VVC53603.1 putative oxidoreductase; putative molybdoenzyme [Beijerinckiaceae bacterium RH AL1]
MTDQEHRPVDLSPYRGPAGGQGSLKSVAEILARENTLMESGALMLKQNKTHGFMCVSCAWAKPAKPHTFEFCENGAKATAWELTSRTIDDAFFARHSVSELRTWSDYKLEEAGRLTKPMRYDRASDHYVPVSWDEAIAAIGGTLKTMNPGKVVLYSSGRTSLEASYMYALFGRIYGTNNFPDSSNMCHESTSVALPESIGQPVGTVALDDFEHCDLIFFFGQNVGANAPRMLHQLQEARRRGCEIITFNPLRERGLERFANPQNPIELALDKGEIISTQYLQVKCGGDIAAMYGLCKAIFAADARAKASGAARAIDADFVGEHTSGLDAFRASAEAYEWPELERASGLSRVDLERAADTYMRSKAAIGIYGMGLTQHRKGVEACQMVANLLLLRGNIGKPGAGICPVRGHSNVQGQRTVGITEKPALVPYDKLRALYHFEPPEKTGLNTVEACEKILEGEIEAFIGLGGNFVRAIPETELIEAAWRKVPLSVEISTKLNRSHLIFGEAAYILPTLGRIEVDRQATGRQAVSMEDSTAHIHGSKGVRRPISEDLRSEPWIVAALAEATLPPGKATVDWKAWVADYALVRDAIAATYPDDFHDFNDRLFTPGGFSRKLAARERKWNTKSGKATFIVPAGLDEDPDEVKRGDVLQLITLRSNDQFNTTVYGYDDRFRGIKGTRMVLLMNARDIARFGLAAGQEVTLSAFTLDDVKREVSGLRVHEYSIPDGCVGAYYPECNTLIPLWHHAERSKVPAAKSVPVVIKLASGEVARPV